MIKLNIDLENVNGDLELILALSATLCQPLVKLHIRTLSERLCYLENLWRDQTPTSLISMHPVSICTQESINLNRNCQVQSSITGRQIQQWPKHFEASQEWIIRNCHNFVLLMPYSFNPSTWKLHFKKPLEIKSYVKAAARYCCRNCILTLKLTALQALKLGSIRQRLNTAKTEQDKVGEIEISKWQEVTQTFNFCYWV